MRSGETSDRKIATPRQQDRRVLCLREQHDSGHFRLLTNNPEDRIHAVLSNERVNVIELRPCQRDTIAGRSTHDVGTSIAGNGIVARKDFQGIFLPERIDFLGYRVQLIIDDKKKFP